MDWTRKVNPVTLFIKNLKAAQKSLLSPILHNCIIQFLIILQEVYRMM